MTKTMIRRAAPTDAGILACLHKASFATPWTKTAMAGLLANGACAWIIALEGADMGFTLMRIAADEAEVLSIGVKPAARKGGLGKKLLHMAMSGARSGGAHSLFVDVARQNTAACALYESAGFERVGIRKNYYENGDDALCYRGCLV